MNSCNYRIHYPDHYSLQLWQKLSSSLISAVNARTILAIHSCSYCKHYPRYLVLQLLQRLCSPLTLAVTAKTNLAVKLRNYCKNYPRHEFMQLPHKLSSPLIFAATAKTILAMKFCSYCRNYPRHEFLRLISLHRSTSEPRALNKMTTMSTVSSIEAHATFCLLARHVLRLRVSAWRQFRGRLAFSYHVRPAN